MPEQKIQRLLLVRAEAEQPRKEWHPMLKRLKIMVWIRKMKFGIGALVTLLEPLTAGMRLQQRPGGCKVLKCRKARPKQNPSADLTPGIERSRPCISGRGKSSSQERTWPQRVVLCGWNNKKMDEGKRRAYNKLYNVQCTSLTPGTLPPSLRCLIDHAVPKSIPKSTLWIKKPNEMGSIWPYTSWHSFQL